MRQLTFALSAALAIGALASLHVARAQTPGAGGPAAPIIPGASVSTGIAPSRAIGHPTVALPHDVRAQGGRLRNAPGHRPGIQHVQRGRRRLHRLLQRREPDRSRLARGDVLYRAAGRPELRARDRGRQGFDVLLASGAAGLNDSRWPMATTWPPAVVTDDRSYTQIAQIFRNAEFIWTKNLKLDNLVLARYTAKGPRR